MRFIEGNTSEATGYIAKRLTTLLSSGKSVLWLVSGGSNIAIQTAAMVNVPANLTHNLTILPIDERFGPYNHPDSNMAKLRRAGFDPKFSEWIDILEDNPTVEQATELLGDLLAREIAIDDYFFATLGMGDDGHTAGILPNSPALNVLDLVTHYNGGDFERITVCADAIIAHCKEVVLSAYGGGKAKALQNLAKGPDNREQMPVNILHDINDCVVFNDTIKGVV